MLAETANTPAKRQAWWDRLEPQWQAAFRMATWRHNNPPSDAELTELWQAPALRFVGPTAPYPNLSFELTNASGLAGMSQLTVLVLTNHQVTTIDEVAAMPDLQALFLNNNAITDLSPVTDLTKLELLYVYANGISSLEPVRNLTKLKELYASRNQLTSLDGLTRQHARRLETFFCLPNDSIPDEELTRVEQELGIRCRRH